MAVLGVWAAGCLMFLVTARCFSEDLIFFGKPVPNHWSNPFRILNARPGHNRNLLYSCRQLSIDKRD